MEEESTFKLVKSSLNFKARELNNDSINNLLGRELKLFNIKSLLDFVQEENELWVKRT
jgi:hypothetical protein